VHRRFVGGLDALEGGGVFRALRGGG